MKQLILINGAMGVGKTTVCQILKKYLPACAFLDGDWCWDMSPFVVNEETKAMVLQNIAFLLNQFLRCSAYQNVLFCWVMHQQSILDEILARMEPEHTAHCFTLTCKEETLRARLQKDIAQNKRTPDVIPRSLERAQHYGNMCTQKMVTDHKSAHAVAQEIYSILYPPV